jgi:hypothetical protein
VLVADKFVIDYADGIRAADNTHATGIAKLVGGYEDALTFFAAPVAAVPNLLAFSWWPIQFRQGCH